MKALIVLLLAMYAAMPLYADEAVSKYEETPYSEQKVVFDFYFDDPAKINTALFWIRSLINPLMDEPYGMAPELLDIKVIIHGTEIVTVARKNFEKYREAVERMRYYASLGVDFGGTTADNKITLEAVYCLGNCACSPSVRLDEQIHARVDATGLDALLADLGDGQG